MKPDRVTATSQPLPGSMAYLPAEVARLQRVPRVDVAEAVEADRRRSLRQELDEIEAQAVGPFAGEGRVREETHRLASQLSDLGTQAVRLVRGNWHAIDTEI